VKETFKEKALLADALSQVFPEFAKHDVTKALEIIEESDSPWLVPILAAEWSKVDFQAAFAWANQLMEEERMLAQMAVGAEWVKIDPEAALAFFMADDGESPAFDSALAAWGEHDPQAALQWVKSSEFAHNSAAFDLVFGSWIEVRPKEGLIALNELEDPEMKQNLMHRAFQVLWHDSPEEAAQCLLLLGDEMRSASVGILVTRWYEIDPEEVKIWVLSVEEETLREMALESLILNSAEAESEATVELLEHLHNPERREAVLNRVGPLWLYQKKELGRRWLGSLGVSDEKIQTFEERILEHLPANKADASKKKDDTPGHTE
jgi:hypothetical protein